MATAFDEHGTRTQPVRLWPPILILLLGVSGVICIQTGKLTLTSRPSVDLHFLIWSTEIALFLWAMYWSRLTPTGRVKFVFAAFALQTGAYLMFRVDGFDGDGRAIMALRWSPTPDELFVVTESIPATRSLGGVRVEPGEWDVTGYRGRNRDGIIEAPPFETDWEAHPPRELWRQTVGVGWSSFAVVGDYCFTQEQRGEFETVVCYELVTGRQVWEHRDRAYFKEMTGGNGPRATPTYAWDRIYTLGATGILNCLDAATGHAHWSTNILDDADVENRLFGMCASPLVVNEDVVVCPGGRDASMVAYHWESGHRVWRGGSAAASYSSPQIGELAGFWILNFNAEGLSGHTFSGGKELWSYPWVSNPEERNNVCQPVPLPDSRPDNGRVFVASGYDKGCALLEVRRLAGPNEFEVVPVWQNRNLKAKFTSVVLHDGFIYGLDERILTCLDVNTGERRWKNGRYGHGQILLVNDTLLIQAESGEVCLVDADPDQFREITRLQALTERTWNQPVVAGRYLLVRNDREAVCYELPALGK
jgi:outer membrane protein assembly factor BamB